MNTIKYHKISHLEDKLFLRCTGVTKFIFEIMVLEVKEYLILHKKKEGRSNILTIEDRILMLLEHYREYRTFFHIGIDYGLNETNVQRNIEQIEAILIASEYFRLEGKKVLLDEKLVQNIRIDVTECHAQRPKKK